ncbi:intermembrane lipid transfer protein VPS13B isoform X1 [Athalia rosae]|uniref:intermembrane lipid transfer protein VPS13B isoform X1 n=1 Tax=Athalia rosae TaxID=37344 RepID=UPI002033EBEE|nr:intermembrane lipid transfer protein VPS13B isoform X1 [Athalia rosae]XP_048505378.1 intermembrane lipid transfer protein VPS13B isoform X1 [Athalia rosae]
MFNLESYVTPVILSYVEKYVKNFKPEQSQVSLWGGDASFQNLDLRLEVLEEQLNLPFSFVSGHIHELLIHVPWVKITSEPIVVTINTIECILKLKDETQGEPTVHKPPKRKKEQKEEETPPGYIKSMVTKVVNNITINCNNLILKYVEEDIVLSVNIRFLSMQSVNNKWEPAFTDVSSYEVLLRKLITIQDLTLCLDKMDASGKIEVYQDPVLYRCSMIIRLIVNYHSNTAKRASVTRLDLHCEKMEFSMTEQQIPMLLRLIALVMALQTKMLPASKERSLISSEEGTENDREDDSESDSGSQQEGASWAGWAWNMVPSVLPVHWDNDWSSEQLMAYAGHTIHMGFYVDDATVTFKTMDSVKEQLFYKPRKIRYKSFLSLKLNGVVIDVLLQDMTWTRMLAGLGSINLFPRGTCSCGHLEVIDGAQPPLYMCAGKRGNNHLKDSLFDENATENKGKKRVYKHGIDYHLATVSVDNLLERCPAFVMDYIYLIDLPDDITPEKLAEFNSNFEYSNFHEHRVVRYVIGELTVRMCSGLFHRIESIQQAAMKYDYAPYVVLKPEPTIDELPPVTVEEYDALRENISKVEIKLILIKGTIELQLADHQITGIPRRRKFVEKKTAPLTPALSDDPILSIEWDKLLVNIDQPMYPHRLAACACKQAELPSDMLKSCHRLINAAAHGLNCQLYLTRDSRTTIVMPFTISYTMKMLLYPQYWLSLNMAHVFHHFQFDGITITGTKVKLMIATSILSSIIDPKNTLNPMICSSLFNDACQERDPVYLELCLEGISGKSISSLATVSNILNIASVKIFLLNDFQQTFVLSGPESDLQSEADTKPLLSAVVQFSKDPSKQLHPPILSFQVSEIRGSLDPLLSQWLQYYPVYYKLDQASTIPLEVQQPAPGELSPDASVRKKHFPGLSQSVHSSSDKEKRKSGITADGSNSRSKMDDPPKSDQKTETLSSQANLQKMGVLDRMVDWYPGWRGLVLSGYIGHIVIYIPTTTMSGIGVHGIEQAKEQALREDQNLRMLVIRTPSLYLNSTNMQAETLSQYLKDLPVQLPKAIWTPEIQSFPWTVNVNDFHCYTLQRELKRNLIKKVSLNATVGLTAKTATESSSISKPPLANKLAALSLYVHIDTTPITVSISEEQVVFISSIAVNILNVMQGIYPSMPSRSTTDVPGEMQTILPTLVQSSPNQTLFREDSATTSTLSTTREDVGQETDSLTLTAWVQWTINKLAVKFYVMGQSEGASSKIILELEDIITSLDLQPVYLKLKTKITTATILNYVRQPNTQGWDRAEYGGLVMCGREDNSEKGEDSGFLSLVLTRAKCGEVHTRWGTQKRRKLQRSESRSDTSQFMSGYISELVIKMQMLDIILPLSIIGKYTQLVEPFMHLTRRSHNKTIDNAPGKFTSSTLGGLANLRNDSLPLVYLEFKGCRLMLPASADARCKLLHDLLIIQLDGISITPHAENPICRIPIRSDIYQLAAQANILNVPGSAVEDRQYQINVKGVCADTTTWKNYKLSITKRSSQSYLYTMNENPALEWNKLGSGSSLEPNLSTFPLITRFDLCLIIAPATVFKPDTIVCGNAVEINCLTDIDITINLNQIELISTLSNEFKTFFIESIVERDESLFTIKSSTARPASCAPISEEADIDFAKDSGVDFEMSSINSTVIGKSTRRGTTLLPPFEFLVNCGKITLILYETKQATTSSEYEMDTNEGDDIEDDVIQPLLYIMIDQPNIYISQQTLSQKLQVTCFDVTIALGNEQKKHSTPIPSPADFNVCLMETKNGDPHIDTGIPPSFVTVKCNWQLTKNPHYSVIIGRPTKIHCSISRLNHIESTKNKLIACYSDGTIAKLPSYSPRESNHPMEQPSPRTLHNKYNIPDLNISTKQIVLSINTDSGSEILISLSALTGNTSTAIRPERIYQNVSLDSLIISVVLHGNIKVLLNPWCCNITLYLLWEPWQDVDTVPQIQIQADSESLYLDIGPEQMKIMSTVIQDCQIIATSFNQPPTEEGQTQVKRAVTSNSDQHYKDDLKAGAFQFIDGNGDELPFPYQVIFLTCPQQAMAWRYPQPRALTKLHVSPVPFKASVNESECEERVPCSIEYWSESHSAFQHYANFYLSETDSYRLDFPDKTPARAVACIWRVVLRPTKSQTHANTLVSARVLAACLRIDSYFNSTIVPNLQAALNIGTIHVAFYNCVNSSSYSRLPAPLQNFTLDSYIPTTQCYLNFEHKKAIVVLNRWADNSVMVDIGGIVSIRVLDYGLLNMHEVLDPLEGKVQLSIADRIDLSVVCNPFSLKFGPAVSHTLAVSAHLWAIAFDSENKNVVVLTRYVIANDSNIPIRFGQSGTEDNTILQSRQCHFYFWRSVNNQLLRIAIEDNSWAWSQAFAVNKNGIQVIDFGNNASKNITIFVNITSLSATQKLITFSGQLVITNQMVDNFEMKLVKYEAANEATIIPSKNVHIIKGKSQPASTVLENTQNMAMRLRFASLTNLSWTGDIPLQPNMKCSQPWLVKVPLQERGQFLSIWVRIILQVIHGRTKILAVLSPLYMIRSYLPVPAKVQMETPSLKVSLSANVNGSGERQQLYCPGTFEHFHQLTFQLESGISASNPYVPLSYSSVDQRKFFRRPEKEDIETILKELEIIKDEPQWPFQSDDVPEWTSAEQPQTHVQVKYQDAGLISSTLLLELQPWCFILNSLGCHLSLVSEDIELCQVPHYGIVTPPKLDGTFHFGVGLGDTYYTSPALQLARPDWSQSFYMPRIGGLIPLEGNMKTAVDCGSSLCMVSVNSSMHEDMRLVRVSSSHVIANLTPQELCVATLAVNETSSNLQVPDDLTPFSLNILPSDDKKYATPIVQWYLLFEQEIVDPMALYISLSLGHQWSCPIRVDQGMSRRCLAIPNGSVTMPIVVTTQEDKGTTYITIHIDKHPQLLISNGCAFKILLGQGNADANGILAESPQFSWICDVESGGSCHYSLPAVGSRLPDSPALSITPLLLLTSVSNSGCDASQSMSWSRGVSLSATSAQSDQYVRLPYHGDIKLVMYTRCYTTYINILPISQVEISARDIRSRLFHNESRSTDVETLYNRQLANSSDETTHPLLAQSSPSSTSLTSFFSAQEDISGTDSPVSSQHNLKHVNAKSKKNTRGTQELCNHGRLIAESNSVSTREKSVTIHLRGVTITITQDVNENAQTIEIASLSITDLFFTMEPKENILSSWICIGDLQLDNQLFDQGGFDFPVVLIGQNPAIKKELGPSLNSSLNSILTELQKSSLLAINMTFEKDGEISGIKDFRVTMAPVSAYIEDTYITQLLDYATSLVPPCFALPVDNVKNLAVPILSTVHVPDYIMMDAKILSSPLRLQNLIIDPVSILLSVHTSVRLYLALDHSPLYFGTFERKSLLTTPYRLGNALTMHYLSGAIFGAGWVVGSLEILGSPGGLAQALGCGLRDFVSLPFQGLLHGPWGFVVGVTHGSASLMKHVTAGTVNSVTKLASSVARNLDRLTLDVEHLQRQEESRRMRPQGMAQGLYQGLTGFGMSLLAAVAGIAHHPLQQVWSGEATTRGLVAGVGLGLVGVVTKPLSGAAELVALTGQGLLQGAGWNSLPSPRQRPVVQYSTASNHTPIRYAWRLMPLLVKGRDNILHIINADHVIHQGSNQAVSLILTRQVLLVVNIAEDSTEKIFTLNELTSIDHPSDTTMLCLHCPPTVTQLATPSSPREYREMDQEMRARVAEYVRTSTSGLASLPTDSDAQSDNSEPVMPPADNTITFYVSPDSRNYFLSLLNVAKRQSQGKGFQVL